MKIFKGKISEEHLPYLILWLILAFFSVIMFSSFLFLKNTSSKGPAWPYAQGYYIRSRAAGSVRVIPFAGSSFKSPVSNTIKAVISPYIEEDENSLPAKQKSQSY